MSSILNVIARYQLIALVDSPDCTNLLDELRDTLLSNARGVFQWAKVWLHLLLAVEDTDRMAIKSETDAREWLDRLRKDLSESLNEYDLLTSGYQRLWDITCIRDRDDFKQRARLFQLVLADIRPPTTRMLSAALRIRNDKFDRYPQPEAIMPLCSNFLTLNDGTGHLQFVHSSARHFIRELNMKQDKLAKGKEEKFFSDQRNHESVARLYMDLIGSATHPYWNKVGFEMDKWNDHPLDSKERHPVMGNLKTIGTKGHAPNGILAKYLMKYGLSHFPKAARKRSLDDPIWKDFVQHLVLSSDSAFGAVLLDRTDNWFLIPVLPFMRLPESRSCLLLEGRRFRILSSHILACLPVFDEYDCLSATSTRNTAGARDSVELLKDICTVGGDPEAKRVGLPIYYGDNLGDEGPIEANALHIACRFYNEGAVRAILHAAKLSSPNTLSDILCSRTRQQSFPLLIAIHGSNATIASILLEADRQLVSKNAQTGGPEGMSSTYTSSQWELACGFGYPYVSDTILVYAIERLKEEEILSLLKIAGPENINARYLEGQTLLHYAVKNQKDALARALVEIYGADKTARNSDGKTPFQLGTPNEESVLGKQS